jgi:hypothetical protein
MKKNAVKKLALAKETVRNLESSFRHVEGGATGAAACTTYGTNNCSNLCGTTSYRTCDGCGSELC